MQTARDGIKKKLSNCALISFQCISPSRCSKSKPSFKRWAHPAFATILLATRWRHWVFLILWFYSNMNKIWWDIPKDSSSCTRSRGSSSSSIKQEVKIQSLVEPNAAPHTLPKDTVALARERLWPGLGQVQNLTEEAEEVRGARREV